MEVPVSDDFATQVGGVSALAEPARRSLYLFVAAQPDAVSREQAAAGCELAAHTAKFHLDRLVDEGLLEVEYRRLSGRTGPGAGRPSKLYRRSAREVRVSLPERRYDVAGRVLAVAVDRAIDGDVPLRKAVDEAAAAEGRELAADAPRRGGERTRLAAALSTYGYEPRTAGGVTTLVNCPFDAMAREHTDLVCGLNLGLVRGVIDGLGLETVEAVLDPGEGRCCVTCRPAEGRRR